MAVENSPSYEVVVNSILDRFGSVVDDGKEDGKLADFGLDSLDTLQLVLDVEDSLGISLLGYEEQMHEETTLREFCALCDERLAIGKVN